MHPSRSLPFCSQDGKDLIGPVKHVLRETLMHQMRDQVLRTDLLSKSLLSQTTSLVFLPMPLQVLLETALQRLHPKR